MEKIWKKIYLCITESLFRSAEIKPNIVNQLYFNKIFWSKFKKGLRGLSGLWTSRWLIGIPGGGSDQRLKEPSHLLIMKKTMKSWGEISPEAWPAGIEGSPGYLSSSLPDSALFSTRFFKFLAALDLHGSALPPSGGGFSCCRAWAPGAWASVVTAHRLRVVERRPSCPSACGILDQGSNPCPLH